MLDKLKFIGQFRSKNLIFEKLLHFFQYEVVRKFEVPLFLKNLKKKYLAHQISEDTFR